MAGGLVLAGCQAPPALYTNPILHADYSDPDVIRVGDDFYMVSSSFNEAPGLPLLHSKDLVHWRLIGHALQQLQPADHFTVPAHGDGVWAPCLRYHEGLFYLFYPDPDVGIFLTTAKAVEGEWSPPRLILPGSGLIDPTPVWDHDGKTYLIHAWAKSRAGINNRLTLQPMQSDFSAASGAGNTLIDGALLPGYVTLEGPKFYQRKGFYYVFAPAGGVSTGWQSVFRARALEGPYEARIVMAQGSSATNGPHQGAWVDTAEGEDWFLHFQDKGAYGRIVHLQPLKWLDDWPVIGVDVTGEGAGEPVAQYVAPQLPRSRFSVVDDDDFSENVLGVQWSWNANWQRDWYSLSARPGWLRLYAQPSQRTDGENLWLEPALLLQKFPAENFTVTTQLQLSAQREKLTAGLLVYGQDYAWLGLRQQDDGVWLVQHVCTGAVSICKVYDLPVLKLRTAQVTLRLTVRTGATVNFSYREEGGAWHSLPMGFISREGRWVGARFGLFAAGPSAQASVDVDFIQVDIQ